MSTKQKNPVLSECDPVAMEWISPCWNTSAPSSGITSCSMASTSSIESSSAGAGAQKESSLAYKITWISLVPLIVERREIPLLLVSDPNSRYRVSGHG